MRVQNAIGSLTRCLFNRNTFVPVSYVPSKDSRLYYYLWVIPVLGQCGDLSIMALIIYGFS
jgi:hypothetical protein